MALIKIELQAPPIDGMDIKFKAPCNCSAITGLLVTYPEGSQEFTFRDCHGNNVAGIGGLFAEGAYVKVIVDVERGRAYLQNADNNSFLNSAIFGTYTHSGNSLTGAGENGKFKATASGTISTINVNGVSCSVKCGEESSMDLIAGCWYTFILDGNTVNFNAGGAGGGLNFAVVKNPQPASPKDNTIWVNTDVDITGWIFSATQPENLAEGNVWFPVGTSSPVAFNALKKNGITVCPLYAKQYVDGAWVEKTAKIYQNGAWADWIIYLYDTGKEFTENGGSWVAYDSSGRFSKEADHMRLYTVNPNDSMSTFGTEGLVELTDVNTVCARIYMTSSVVGADLCMFANKSKANAAVTVLNSPAVVRYEDTSIYIGETVTVKLDVGSLTGTYYIGFASIFQNDFKVMSVWME